MGNVVCRYRRLLVIAPGDSGLEVVPEIDALFELGYSPQIVQGQVTRERLFQIVRNREFDGIHFAGHSDRDGVILSGDELMEAPSVVQLVKATGAQFVFLNGCETAEIGQLLVDEHVPAVICTLRRVSDTMAQETAQVFYKALAELGDLRSAYNESKPPVKGGYSLFTNGIEENLLAPVLKRLEEFAAFVETDREAHEQISMSLANLTRNMGDIGAVKGWMVRVFAAACAVNALVTGLILVLDKATP
jgi:hypothetical protein